MGNLFDFIQKEKSDEISKAVYEAYSPIRESELQLKRIKSYLSARKKFLEQFAPNSATMYSEYELRKVKNLLDPINCKAPTFTIFTIKKKKDG